MYERTVSITEQDVQFVKLALKDYRAFAEALERQDEKRIAGLMRKQEFYAERFLTRLGP